MNQGSNRQADPGPNPSQALLDRGADHGVTALHEVADGQKRNS